ncbi:MAG: RNA-binding S4 domain-containing protein [Pseudomonadota bacterium]|nr:RNA-binding S4 domain-containing protein [Pseudomonadota bacterium]
MKNTSDSLRLDKWLWHARFFKSRTLAAKQITGGKCRVNKQIIKKARYQLHRGDVLTFAQGQRIRIIRVRALGERRGPASEARDLYEDLETPKSVDCSPTLLSAPSRIRGFGRPTKKDRRALERARAYFG